MRVRTFPPAGRKTHMRNDTINAGALRLRLWYHNCKTVIITEFMRVRTFPPAGRKTHMRNDTINADALRLRL